MFLFALVIGFVWTAGVAAAIIWYGQQDNAQPSDAIIILGAGVRPNDTPTFAQTRRTYQAYMLWRDGFAPHIICTGAVSLRSTISEAEACRRLLLEWGVPHDAIFLEEQSRSTEENAVYAQRLMDANGWRSAIVVSDRYHLLRANWMFSKTGIEAHTSPVTFVRIRPDIFLRSITREIIALHWQAAKDVIGLPVTSVPVV